MPKLPLKLQVPTGVALCLGEDLACKLKLKYLFL